MDSSEFWELEMGVFVVHIGFVGHICLLCVSFVVCQGYCVSNVG